MFGFANRLMCAPFKGSCFWKNVYLYISENVDMFEHAKYQHELLIYEIVPESVP